MRVVPVNPTLKAPVSKRSKLKCDKLLSNVAFNFNLRRYMKVGWNYIVVDEGHRLKNHESKLSKVLAAAYTARPYTPPHLSST